MIRFYSVFFAITLFFSSVAQAMTAEESEHARSSFSLLQKKEWSDALLHARATHDEAMQNLMLWLYFMDADNGASFSDIKKFIETHPDWPEQRKLRIRAEMALKTSTATADEIIEWFSKNTPLTGVGKLALAKALAAGSNQSKDTIVSLVREAWREGDFEEAQEQSIISDYGNIIKASDDISRIDRLLWEGKSGAAERMMHRVGEEYQNLYRARISLQENKKDALKQLSRVAPSLRKDVGLIYDRMRYHLKKDEKSLVIAMLLAAPKEVPYPEKWWRPREAAIREALDDGNVALASQLLANHGQSEGQGVADASWLRGQILLEYQQKPKEAYNVFTKMFAAVNYPVSKARAAYWAAKSAMLMGNREMMEKWLNIAAGYPTTFYGQLAALKYSGNAPLALPLAPQVSEQERIEFNSRSVVRAIRTCIEFNQFDLAGRFINYLAENAETGKDALMVSELGLKAGKIYLGVRGAKKALQGNVVLVGVGYPMIKVPDNLPVPKALTLALARQESEFDRFARSGSGAMGLMQLLPSTAKEVAKKSGLAFSEDRLYEENYNLTLGSLYIGKLIDYYNGSLPLAIAAYNGGMGNVNKWIKRFGRPSGDIDSVVDWIEKIPFAETRNYVQRVMENLQIYRHLDAGDNSATLMLGEDMKM